MKERKMLRIAIIGIILSGFFGCNRRTSPEQVDPEASAPSTIVERSTRVTPNNMEHMQLLDSEHWFSSDSFKLWKTDDGGRTWAVSYSAKADDNVRQHIRGVSFVSSQVGFLIDRDRLLRTDDAGISWSEIGTIRDTGGDYFIEALCFVDSLHGWAAGSKLGATIDAPPFVGAVLCTKDGGRTWSRQQVSPPDIYSSAARRWDIKDLLFLSEKLGWAVGDDVIFWTKNGGERWERATVNPVNYMFVFDHVRFLDDRNGWTTARDTKEFFVTDDGGRHWHLRSGPGRFLGPSAEVVFLDSRRAFAINRFLYETKDGGRRWSRRFADSPDQGPEYLGIDRARDGTLIAFGFDTSGRVIMVSRDSGATWELYTN
jgi:photosystem II stability/assembly factor-like uncharacterized protein